MESAASIISSRVFHTGVELTELLSVLEFLAPLAEQLSTPRSVFHVGLLPTDLGQWRMVRLTGPKPMVMGLAGIHHRQPRPGGASCNPERFRQRKRLCQCMWPQGANIEALRLPLAECPNREFQHLKVIDAIEPKSEAATFRSGNLPAGLG